MIRGESLRRAESALYRAPRMELPKDDGVVRRVADEIEQVEKATAEQCAKLVCPGCAVGSKIVDRWHVSKVDGLPESRCMAWPILFTYSLDGYESADLRPAVGKKLKNPTLPVKERQG